MTDARFPISLGAISTAERIFNSMVENGSVTYEMADGTTLVANVEYDTLTNFARFYDEVGQFGMFDTPATMVGDTQFKKALSYVLQRRDNRKDDRLP